MKLYTEKQLEERTIRDALTDSGKCYVNSFVHWEKPKKPNQFMFPVVCVKISYVTGDGEQQVLQWTSSGRKDRPGDMMQELYAECLHPGMRIINMRYLLEQVKKIVLTEEYQIAYKKFLELLEKERKG